MLELINEMLSYSFLTRAILVGTLVSLCASLLGVSLVLKRYSMIGDGLSHVGFGALAVATAVGAAPLAVAVPVVMLAAFLLLRLNSSARMKGDAAIALISTGALAIGVMVITFSTGMNIDVYNYMFGSVLAMSGDDVILSVILSAVVLVLYTIFYGHLFSITFDESFARATGTKASLYNTLLALLTAVTIVIGMRLMGALLISGLMIFPALTAMRTCKSFRSVTVTAAILSVVCFLVGITLSYALATPAGASVICVNIVAFLIFSLIAALREHKRGGVRKPHGEPRSEGKN